MKCDDYYFVRDKIQDGDIFLWSGNGIMARSIMYFDDAQYNHISVVKWIGKRVFNIDMWYHGIEINPLSRRMLYDYKRFCCIRPLGVEKELINNAIENILEKVEALRRYDYWLLPRIALLKKTGIDLTRFGRGDRYICSELIQTYTNDLRIESYERLKLITPQDFLRFADVTSVEILYNEPIFN